MPMYGQKKATIKGTATSKPVAKKPTIKEPGVKKMGTPKDLLSGIKKKTK